VPVVSIGRVGDDALCIVASSPEGEAGATAGTMLTATLDELAQAHGALSKLFA
jgi:hypothetical protein